jgi:signal peptidase
MSAHVETGTSGQLAGPARLGSRGHLVRARTWAYRVLLAVLLLLALYATLVPFAIQRSDSRLVTLTSGSMSPTYLAGETITVSTTSDPAALSVGDVITFRALGSGVVVTHRIVDVIERDTLDGVHYRTRGDANDSADPDLVPAANVIALVNGPLPAWQRVAVDLQTPMGRFVVYGSLFLVIALGEIADVVRLWRRPETEDAS